MNLGDIIKEYRLGKNYSQEHVAEIAGLNEKHYGKIERNQTNPTVKNLQNICRALDIDIAELFLCLCDNDKRNFSLIPKYSKAIIKGLRKEIDLHFNRNIIMKDCESSIWYSGYLGSICFDEFEIKIYAEGKIRGQLFWNFSKVAQINSENGFPELEKYVHNDLELKAISEYMSYDEDKLKEHNGNVLFLEATNWFALDIVNKNSGNIIDKDIIQDKDNITELFLDTDTMIEYIFNEGGKVE